MPEEIKDTGNVVYRKFAASGQRTSQQPEPKCAEVYNGANGPQVCKGLIINARCSKCGLWYGPGIDPNFQIKTK